MLVISLKELMAGIIPPNQSHLKEQLQYAVFFPSHLSPDVLCELSPILNMFKERFWKKIQTPAFKNQTNFAPLI